ncbi:hypothetical protein BUALT_Bualt14G0116700 [Buddleja alternifolia]|uniref:RING-type domain-containing protein n=1 Tax=Buddleja alternifolia TaxID=168488 RepID=A0AAV6WPS4_9LAMI|nr:hypothetical protein BUALT_Bualt14G0116700 [Buddleja alternifolia]
MGMQQSKDELLYQQVNSGKIDGIKSLRSEGAGLEWVDREGKTPLIVACMNPELHNVAKTLIELGANVNAYRPGRQAGTPLHHAAKRGLEQTVKLLLSHGANALVMNDDCQTPLDVARAKGFSNVVRAIEAHLCLFSGWLRELYGPGFLELLAPQLLSRKVWVVVLPCGSRNLRNPFKLELAIYAGAQDAQPRTIVPLWKANLDEPNFNQPDPAAIISDVSRIPRRWRRRRAIKSSQEARRTRIKLAPLNASEKHQLQRFCNACKGIPQAIHPLVPLYNRVVPTAPPNVPQTSENEGLSMAINSSIQSTSHETPQHTDSSIGSASTSSASEESYISGPSTSHNPNGKKCEVEEASSAGNPAQHLQYPVSTPSAPLVDVATDDGPINYPSIDTSAVDFSSPTLNVITDEMKEDISGSSCTICLDAPLEGACVPCGHMAGCMSCLNEIKAKKWGCPVCRTKIDQIIRIYAV